MYLLASEASHLSPTAIFMRGIAVVVVAVIVFVGSIWLVLSTDVGARKAIMVVLACWFAFISMLSLLWFRYPAQAPKPSGPVCLGGQINPAFSANGGAEGEQSVTVKKVVDGQTVDEKIFACDGGMLFTKFFYPTIFLIAGLLLSSLCVLGLSRIEKSERLADELAAAAAG